jgi:3-phenylpropionate/trans-cinnamate dioxygenase ferredoxin component
MKHIVAPANEIAPGTAKAFALEGNDVLVCNVDGAFYAIEDVCTHDGGALDQGTLEGRCVVCPRHGAAFDVETGAAVRLPAVMGLQTYSVRVEDAAIVIEL